MGQIIDLYVPCMGCSKGSARYWYHGSCGGKMQISEYANLICSKCYYSAVIFKWKATCQSHSQTPTQISKYGVAYALSIMMELNADSEFIGKLSAAIHRNRPT